MGRGLTVVMLLACLMLAACGSGDNQTVFILPSGSASASGSTVPATGSATPGAQASPSTSAGGISATPIPGGSKIIIDSPDASSPIASPVQVSGAASVLNGTVVAVVLDSGGSELGRAQTTASASSPDFGHFDVSVPFTGATSGARGQIKVFGVRADGTTPTYYYYIAVRFA